MALKKILTFFVQATRLCTNLQKTKVYPISCDGANLEDILGGFPAAVKSLPCRYLGIPLHFKKLRWVDYVPLPDKVGCNLPGWKGKLMNKATRAQLVKTVLTFIVTYHAIVFPLPKWLIKKIDKLKEEILYGKERKERATRAMFVW